jgi:hypothetical protein
MLIRVLQVMNLPRDHHAILLYSNDLSRNQTAAKCINQGLREGQLCIYASVGAYDKSYITKISSLIESYKENVEERNLLIVDLKPFYDSALEDDLTPFNEFITQLQEELQMRKDKSKSKDLLIIADCADNLFTNRHFDQCETVENWWHDIYNKWLKEQQKDQQKGGKECSHFTVICPYSAPLLVVNPFSQHKHQISHNHSITIDTEGHNVSGYIRSREIEASSKSVYSPVKSAQIIIAEPDPDLRLLYGLWQRSTGLVNMKMTDNGRGCIDEFYTYGKENKGDTTSHSDVIVILDTHLKDISFIQVAKEIIIRNPNQHIIFTTTMPPQDIRQEMESAEIKNYSILTKPFELSKLSSLLLRALREA